MVRPLGNQNIAAAAAVVVVVVIGGGDDGAAAAAGGGGSGGLGPVACHSSRHAHPAMAHQIMETPA